MFKPLIPLGIAAGLGLALLAGNAHAQAVCKADRLPFTAPGDLSLDLSPHGQYRPGSLGVEFGAGPDAVTFIRFPDPHGPDKELATVGLQGRAWDLLGSFAMDFKFTWRYTDVVMVPEGHKQWFISRKELAAYPSLMERFRNARPSFDRIEVSMSGVSSKRLNELERHALRITLPHSHLVVDAEDATPPSAPAVLPHWLDRLSIGDSPYQKKAREDEMAARWGQLESVTCKDFFVKIVGLKIPRAELLRIAKLLDEYKAKDKELDKEFALLKDGLGKAAVPAYARNDELARPVEPPVLGAEIVKGLKQGVALQSRGRVVWQSSEYGGIQPLDKAGRFFTVWAKGRTLIVNARGVVQVVDGERSFQRVSAGARAGEYLAELYDPKASPDFVTDKSYSGAPGTLTASEMASFRAKDGNGRCKTYDNIKPGQLFFTGTSRSQYVKGRQLVMDERMKLTRREEAYFRTGSPGSEVGRRICDA